MAVRSDAADPQFELVCAIVRGQADKVASLAKAAEFNSETFLQYADIQRLAASIFHAAQRHSILSLLPSQVVENLRKSFLAQFRWNLLLLEKIRELDAAFRRSGHEVIFLKGLNLAEEHYGQIAARQIGDIDVLMRDCDDLRGFEELLAGLGYHRRSRILGSRALMVRYAHHLEFDGTPAPLDLHWVLRRHPSFALDYADLWRRKRMVRVRNVEFLALDLDHELVLQFLSIHTDVEVGILRLKSFVDLYTILTGVARTLDWESFFARRSDEGLLPIAVNVLDLALDVLGCREEFANLAESIEPHRGKLLLTDIDSKLDLFRGKGGATQRKAWALRLYDTSPMRAFFWWGLSLPFRLAEHP